MGILDRVSQIARNAEAALENLAQPSIATAYGGQPGTPTGPTSFPLVGETRSVTLDSNGNGTARWSPGQVAQASSGGVGYSRSGGYSVDTESVVVSVAPLSGNATPIKNASATAYVSFGIQSAGPADSKGTTVNGSLGATLSFTQNLRPGDWITIIWSGGDAGAVATMTVAGTANPPGSK